MRRKQRDEQKCEKKIAHIKTNRKSASSANTNFQHNIISFHFVSFHGILVFPRQQAYDACNSHRRSHTCMYCTRFILRHVEHIIILRNPYNSDVHGHPQIIYTLHSCSFDCYGCQFLRYLYWNNCYKKKREREQQILFKAVARYCYQHTDIDTHKVH